MKLLESISCKKGITLNSQLVDLLSILDENIPQEEQDSKIVEYIDTLRDRVARYNEASEKGIDSQYAFLIDEVIGSIKGLSPEDIEKLKGIYSSSLPDLSICNREEMIKRLEANGFDESIYTKIAKDLKNIDLIAKEGTLDLEPKDVRNLHSHLFENGNAYDRVTFDYVGKYSGYVSFDGETYAPEKMDKMVEFCERHGMSSKINSLIFYDDFPTIYEASLDKRIKNGEEIDKKAMLKDSLIHYVENIGERYGDRIETVDIFNELIYDPDMIENKEVFGEEQKTGEGKYHPRQKGWQEHMDLDDLCEVALAARKSMPNTTFTYNDMNWVNPEKRKEIIKIIQAIQNKEKEYRETGRLGPDEKGLIDTIGIEAHLSTGVDLDEIDRMFDDIRNEIGLPIEITEFDVARSKEEPTSEKEAKKQGIVFEKFAREVEERDDVVGFTIWSQSDDVSFLNDKCGTKVYASVLNSDFEEKEFEPLLDRYTEMMNQQKQGKAIFTSKDIARAFINRDIEGKDTASGKVTNEQKEVTNSKAGQEFDDE